MSFSTRPLALAAAPHPSRPVGVWASGRALTRTEFERALAVAGLVDAEIRETHQVHGHASSAIVRARKRTESGHTRAPR